MTAIRIVEDNQEIAELLSVLVSEGHTVNAVTKNFEGLLTAEAWDGVDGAVIDLNLSGPLTGYDILAFLKDHCPDVRRVVYTASPPGDSRDELAHKVIRKPDSVRMIIEALEENSGGAR